MKRARLPWRWVIATSKKDNDMAVGRTARTGEKCPESGVWKVVGEPSTTAPIAINNVMPPYGDKAVTWQLIMLA